MAVAFGVLAVWRILIQGVTFFAGSRSIYLIVAVISAGILIYIGHLGGQMVYGYGVGTALMSSPPEPSAMVTPPAAASLPMVAVPTATSLLATPAPTVAITARQTPATAATSTPQGAH
jgi:hypothetical protein